MVQTGHTKVKEYRLVWKKQEACKEIRAQSAYLSILNTGLQKSLTDIRFDYYENIWKHEDINQRCLSDRDGI